MKPKVISGQLKLKSKFQKKMVDQKSLLKQKLEDKKDRALLSAIPKDPTPAPPKLISYPPVPGTGRILSSGMTIIGKDTKLSSEVSYGDEIIYRDPMTLIQESRKVILVISDVSVSIEKPFSKDIISYSLFDIKKKDTVENGQKSTDELFRDKLNSKSLKDTEGPKFVEIREKRGMWGYKVIKKEIKNNATREDMLNERVKAKKDKSQWN